jgi:serine/threonine-protein kinase
MGHVYEAEDTVMDRTVALKLISGTYAQDPEFRKRLQREARIAGRLHEPHVVPVHAAGEIDGRLFVDMRLIEGSDLDTLLARSGPLPPARAVAIVRQIASALDAAHAAGVMHRDIKPGNILITGDDFAYLVDFGIANAATEEKLTHMGAVLGTWTYMAPERFTGDSARVTPRADIYALACVLYEALTGSPPYRGDHVSVVGAHLSQPIPRASARRPQIPPGLDDVIARGMAKNPDQRYPTAGEFAQAAVAALARPDQDRATDIVHRSQVVSTPPAAFAGPPAFATPPPSSAQAQVWPSAPGLPTWGQPPPQRPRGGGKPWLWVGGAAAIVVAVIVGLVVFLNRPSPPSPQPSPQPSPSQSSPQADAVKLRILDNGVFVGSSAAPTTIDIFNEPICPPCGVLQRTYATDIETAVDNKKLAVRYHLLNFLDTQSASKDYSTRAVAATYCVAAQNDPDLYIRFYSALFETFFQPLEVEKGGSTDRTSAELAHLAQKVGADSKVISCIESGDDVSIASTKAANGQMTLAGLPGGSSGTPKVYHGTQLVNTDDPNWLTKLIG